MLIKDKEQTLGSGSIRRQHYRPPCDADQCGGNKTVQHLTTVTITHNHSQLQTLHFTIIW